MKILVQLREIYFFNFIFRYDFYLPSSMQQKNRLKELEGCRVKYNPKTVKS
jgi:hypothetical protein